jgi:hypothetical protein
MSRHRTDGGLAEARRRFEEKPAGVNRRAAFSRKYRYLDFVVLEPLV